MKEETKDSLFLTFELYILVNYILYSLVNSYEVSMHRITSVNNFGEIINMICNSLK